MQVLLKTDKTDYYESCWGLKILREKLASVLSAQYDATISVDQVLPTHGCIGGLSLLYLAVLNPGDEVIIPEPTYPAYGLLTLASRSVPVFVSMLAHHSDGSVSVELDVEKIKAAITPKTKMIILTNPGNPTGMVIPGSTIRQLLDVCEKAGIYLVVDEAYRDYAFVPEYQTSLPLVSQSEWLIVASTFSKNMAMSGWRIGFLVVPHNITKALAGMQDALLNCLNNTAQYAAMYALDHPEHTRRFYQLIKHNRDMAMAMLQPLVDQKIFSYTQPAGGIFMFLKTDHHDATDTCMSILYKAKVALIPGGTFGPSGGPFMRLCYARDTDYLEEGINRLITFFM